MSDVSGELLLTVALLGLALPAPAAAGDFSAYVWEERRVTGILDDDVRDLKEALQAQVIELIGQGPWAPFQVVAGNGSAQTVFLSPAETLHALALAWPHLSQPLQQRVREYIFKEQAGLPVLSATYDCSTGKNRKLFEYPSGVAPKALDPAWAAPDAFARAYALWLAVDRGLIAPSPAAVDLIHRSAAKHRGIDNLDLMGWIALARLANRSALDAVARDAALQAEKLLARRLEVSAQTESSQSRGERAAPVAPGRALWLCTPDQREWVPEYANLAPPVARLLADRLAAKNALHLKYTDQTRPGWYVAWGERVVTAKVFTHWPTTTRDVYRAHAYVADAPSAKLRYYLDVAWCKADLYYIEKLVLCIEAHGKKSWHDVRQK